MASLWPHLLGGDRGAVIGALISALISAHHRCPGWPLFHPRCSSWSPRDLFPWNIPAPPRAPRAPRPRWVFCSLRSLGVSLGFFRARPTCTLPISGGLCATHTAPVWQLLPCSSLPHCSLRNLRGPRAPLVTPPCHQGPPLAAATPRAPSQSPGSLLQEAPAAPKLSAHPIYLQLLLHPDYLHTQITAAPAAPKLLQLLPLGWAHPKNGAP